MILAFAAEDASIRTRLQVEFDLFDEGLHVTGGRTGGDDEDIGDNDEVRDVEEEDVFALLVCNRSSRFLGGGGCFWVGGDSGAPRQVGIGAMLPGYGTHAPAAAV